MKLGSGKIGREAGIQNVQMAKLTHFKVTRCGTTSSVDFSLRDFDVRETNPAQAKAYATEAVQSTGCPIGR